MNVGLGALDLGPPEDSLRLARELEAAGYHRHWIAEHQPQPQPLLLVAMVAARTRSIRVGTAGLLFHFYPPSRTAFDFRLLADSFPGRIDAGVCRGRVGGDLEVDQLDGRDRSTHLPRYAERVGTLVHHLRDGAPTVGARTTSAAPEGGASARRSESTDEDTHDPQIWSLGSSAGSARLAARHGLRFGYSLFHRDSVDDPSVPDQYRSTFRAEAPGTRPYLAISVAGVCAATDREARAVAAGHSNPFVHPTVVGSGATCRTRLTEIARRYRADEVVFTPLCLSYEHRVASFRTLAEAWPPARLRPTLAFEPLSRSHALSPVQPEP